jgi:hypothetical protein
MSATPNPEPKSRPIVSLPFLIFALVLLVGGYFGGYELMKQNFYAEEEGKKKSAGALVMPEGAENIKERPNLAGGAPPADGGGPKGGDRPSRRPGGDAEESKDESEKKEEPKAEEPKAEEPKAEEPKAEEPAPAVPAETPAAPAEAPKDGGAPAEQPAPPPVENPQAPAEGGGEKPGGGNN